MICNGVRGSGQVGYGMRDVKVGVTVCVCVYGGCKDGITEKKFMLRKLALFTFLPSLSLRSSPRQ